MKMTKLRYVILFFVASVFLEGLLSIYIPFIHSSQQLLALPSFLVVSIVVLYHLVDFKSMFFVVLSTGFIYDLMHIGQVGIYMLVFTVILLISHYFFIYFKDSLLNVAGLTLGLLLVKELLIGVLYFLILNKEVTFGLVAYRFVRSIPINVIYVSILYYLINIKMSSIFKKIS